MVLLVVTIKLTVTTSDISYYLFGHFCFIFDSNSCIETGEAGKSLWMTWNKGLEPRPLQWGLSLNTWHALQQVNYRGRPTFPIFYTTNDKTGRTRHLEIRICPMKNNISEENEETNCCRKRKNEKHPGSQRGGGKKDGRKKRTIAMQKWGAESTKPMKVKHIEEIEQDKMGEKSSMLTWKEREK